MINPVYIKDMQILDLQLEKIIASLGTNLYNSLKFDLVEYKEFLKKSKKLFIYQQLLKYLLKKNYETPIKYTNNIKVIKMIKYGEEVEVTRKETWIKKIGNKLLIRIIDTWNDNTNISHTEISYFYKDLFMINFCEINIQKLFDLIKNEIN